MGERLYIVPTWVGAASDQYHGGAGIRRRDGGGSVGLSYDKSTGEIYSETDLYTPNGAANVALFGQIDETKAALARLWKASKQKRIDIDELDELCELLHKHSLDVSADDYAHLHYQLESKRHASFMASLSPDERDEVEKEEHLGYVKANADKFPMLALSLGIQPSLQAIRQLEREGLLAPSGRLSNVDWWEIVKTVGGWLLVIVLALKIFSV
jgi:hypothetical protein